MNVFLHLRSNAPPSGCRHLVLAMSIWLALRAAFAANIGNPADVFPLRRGRVANRYVRSFPSPAKRGKVPKGRKGAFFARIALESFLR
jgi:hypothetical protein